MRRNGTLAAAAQETPRFLSDRERVEIDCLRILFGYRNGNIHTAEFGELSADLFTANRVVPLARYLIEHDLSEGIPPEMRKQLFDIIPPADMSITVLDARSAVVALQNHAMADFLANHGVKIGQGENVRAVLHIAWEAFRKRFPEQSKNHESTTAEVLMDAQFEPIKWAVQNFIPQGVTLFVGPPKLGKSWMALGLAIAVSTGGRALGSIPCDQGEVLYLALEDTERRLAGRLHKIMQGTNQEERSGLRALTVNVEWPRVDDGGGAKLRAWLTAHPSARLVLIDTLERWRPARRSGANVYAEDYAALRELTDIAREFPVAIIVVHHTRKAQGEDALDSISGSNGLSGSADGVMVLKRERGRADGTLFMSGRDVEERQLALRFDPAYAMWTILGDANEYMMSVDRQKVIEAIRGSGGSASLKTIQIATALKYDAVKKLLQRMYTDGLLVRTDRGFYTLPTSTTPDLF